MCGDGIVAGNEQCDDGNTVVGRRLLVDVRRRGRLHLPDARAGVQEDRVLRRRRRRPRHRRVVRRRQHDLRRRLQRRSASSSPTACARRARHAPASPPSVCGDGKVSGSRDVRRRQHGLGRRLLVDLPARGRLAVPDAGRAGASPSSAATASSPAPSSATTATTTANDGCSATCKLEPGFAVRGQRGAAARVGVPHDHAAATASRKASSSATTATSSPTTAARRPAPSSPSARAARAPRSAATGSSSRRSSATTATSSSATAAARRARIEPQRLAPAPNVTQAPAADARHPDPLPRHALRGHDGARAGPPRLRVVHRGRRHGPRAVASSAPTASRCGRRTAARRPSRARPTSAGGTTTTGCGDAGRQPVRQARLPRPTTRARRRRSRSPSRGVASNVYQFNNQLFYPLDGLGLERRGEPADRPGLRRHDRAQLLVHERAPLPVHVRGERASRDVQLHRRRRRVGVHQRSARRRPRRRPRRGERAASRSTPPRRRRSGSSTRACTRSTCSRPSGTRAPRLHAHAERLRPHHQPSAHPVCGDGIVAGNEVCDEGADNGTGYGHCTPTARSALTAATASCRARPSSATTART